ncbi:MAG: hypothetical protein PF961_07745 [Planctomycetota bacterium]|jgi:hypothetical protein|nr:hypothetical protein [Planctomycetota bacterium]
MTTPAILEEAQSSLHRIQQFDPKTLPREVELGSELNFADVVAPARRLIDLYSQLHKDVLESLPDAQLNQIKDRANIDYKIFSDILEFSTSVDHPGNIRQSLIDKVTKSYDPTFGILHPWISYSVRKSTDFRRLEDEGRALIQSVRDQADALRKEMVAQKHDAEITLQLIRDTAAQQGVSQESYHFRKESEDHAEEANKWRKASIWLSIALGALAFLSLFFHKVPWLAPKDALEAAQLVIGKGVIFATLFTMLYLCIRNFMSHKHNAVVNKHRQNALSTYQTLVEAANESANRDIVLTHAANCIFTAQSTGYASAKQTDCGPSAQTFVDFAARQGPS